MAGSDHGEPPQPPDVGDGGPALQARVVNVWAIGVGPDGSVYYSDAASEIVGSDGNPIPGTGLHRVRRVRPDGLIETVVGDGIFGSTGDGGPARRARIERIQGITVLEDNSLLISDLAKVRRVSPPLPGLGAGQIVLASEDGSELYVFSPAGRILLTLDALTNDTVYVFGYNAARQLVTIRDRDGRVTTIERDGTGAPVAVVAPNGQRTAVTLDANGQIAGLTGPDSLPVRLQFDSAGMLQGIVAKSGDTLSVKEYDASGRLVSITNPLGGSATYERQTFDTGAEVVVHSATGRSVTISQADLPTGAFQLTTDLTGGMSQQTVVEPDGRVVVTAFNGSVTTYTQTPDPRFGMQAPRVDEVVQLPSGLTRTRQFRRGVTLGDPDDPLSVLVHVDSVIVNGRVSTIRVDNQTNTITSTSAAGRVVVRERDSRGRVTRTTVPGMPDTRQTFDQLGRLSSRSVGGRTRSLGYDVFDRVTTLTDEVGLPHAFAYDAGGRLTERQAPNGSTVSFEYDDNDYAASVTPPGRPVHQLRYNAAGRLTNYIAPDAGDGPALIRSTYDGAGRVASITRPDSSVVSIRYDSTSGSHTMLLPDGDTVRVVRDGTTGRVVQAMITGGAVYSNEYNGGLLTTQTWTGPVQATLTYEYDADFRLRSQQINDDTPVLRSYDPDGLLTSVGQLTLLRHPGNGTVSSASVGGVQTTFGYSPGPEVSEIRAAFGSDTLFAVSLQRDSLGRIVTRSERINGVTSMSTFAYDSVGRLALVTRNGVAVESYEYDDNGSRITATTSSGSVAGVVDAQDRLLRYGSNQYDHTLNGERRRKIVGADTTTYTYGALGGLRVVELPDGTLIEYLIDRSGRRVGKKVDGVLVRGWLYEGPLAIAAELDGAGRVVSRFVYSERANVPEYMVRGGTTYRFVTDERGSVRLVVDVATGAIVQRLDYDAFGRVTQNSEPDFQPMGFAGGLYDHQSGLVRFGARDYDAETGMWTAKDPIGFEGGDANLYAYAFGDPVNAIDITGFQTLVDLTSATTSRGVIANAQATSLRTVLQAVRTGTTVSPSVAPAGAPVLYPWAGTVLVWGSAAIAVLELVTNESECERTTRCIKQWEDEIEWCSENMRTYRDFLQCKDSATHRLRLCISNAPKPWSAPWTDPPWLVP